MQKIIITQEIEPNDANSQLNTAPKPENLDPNETIANQNIAEQFWTKFMIYEKIIYDNMMKKVLRNIINRLIL